MVKEKHMVKGSTQPKFPDGGKLRLYSMRFCPFAQRAHLVLAAKGIPHEVIYIHLKNRPDWFAVINPLGKVPALEISANQIIYESLIVCDYLEEKYPQVPLYPADPLKKANDRILVERFSSAFAPLYKLYEVGFDRTALDALYSSLDVFDTELGNRNTPYFGGDTPQMVDYMLWPWFERLGLLQILLGSEYDFDVKRFEKLVKWIDTMKEDDVVKEYYISPEDHVKFLKSRSDTYDCDMLF